MYKTHCWYFLTLELKTHIVDSGRMARILTISLCFGLFVLLGGSPVLAATNEDASSSPQPVQVNAYELFWPLVAGKTEGDSLYFLKSFKEKLRGLLIFSPAKKAEYEVLLGTKRLLEAEKLVKSGKEELAIKTLSRALGQYENVQANIESIRRASGTLGQSYGGVSNPLSNVQTYLASILPDRTGEVKSKLERIDGLIKDLLPNLP